MDADPSALARLWKARRDWLCETALDKACIGQDHALLGKL
jgi:hypothetical protein